MYLAAHDVKDATRKRALLLYSAGEEVSDIFKTLPDQGEEKDYAKAVTALNVIFSPKLTRHTKFTCLEMLLRIPVNRSIPTAHG